VLAGLIVIFSRGNRVLAPEAATGHWRQPWWQIVVFPGNLLALTFSSSYSQVDCSLFFGCMLRWVVATTGELFPPCSMQAVLLLLVVDDYCFCFTEVTLFLQFCGHQHFTDYCCLWFYW